MTITNNNDDIRSPEHRIKVLKKTLQHTGEKIFALEAELAHRNGYIGVDETKSYFASIRDKDD